MILNKVQHTYLAFRKLELDNFLFKEWALVRDQNSLNILLTDFYNSNMEYTRNI